MMPADAHLAAPGLKSGSLTVAQCDEVLARRPAAKIADAWLEERVLAMRAEVSVRLRGIEERR